MNRSMIRYILGHVLKIEGILLLLPCLVALLYIEKSGFSYLAVAALCLLFGFLMTYKKPANNVFYMKEGCIATALSWIALSLFGCLPFWFSREIPSFVDALFETVSGFTTTGASVLSSVEALSHTALFWRSFTHWIGGMGVLVFLLAIIPMSGGSNINLMRAESPGPSVGKLAPKTRAYARNLYLIYFILTVIEFFLLLAGGMPLFDSICTSFGTAGTGGFGIKNDSFASYSPYLQWVVTVFMILFGINFNVYYIILFRTIYAARKNRTEAAKQTKPCKAEHDAFTPKCAPSSVLRTLKQKLKNAPPLEEVKYYFLIIFASVAIIFISLCRNAMHASDALRHASFQVASIITTTGFSTADFDAWSQSARTVLVALMFIGACAGSTGGGIKVSRIIILLKTVKKELNSYLHPKVIQKINFEGKPVEHEVVRSINVYFITFVMLFSASVFLLSFEGKDLVTNFTAVAATINNIGPGLSLVGPMQNFGLFRPFTKCVLIFDMLAGRLELFPLLILFHPAILKDFFTKSRR